MLRDETAGRVRDALAALAIRHREHLAQHRRPVVDPARIAVHRTPDQPYPGGDQVLVIQCPAALNVANRHVDAVPARLSACIERVDPARGRSEIALQWNVVRRGRWSFKGHRRGPEGGNRGGSEVGQLDVGRFQELLDERLRIEARRNVGDHETSQRQRLRMSRWCRRDGSRKREGCRSGVVGKCRQGTAGREQRPEQELA